MLRSAVALPRVVNLLDPDIISTDIIDHRHPCGWGYRGTLCTVLAGVHCLSRHTVLGHSVWKGLPMLEYQAYRHVLNVRTD